MDISIIIVSWNVREKLRACLSRLFLSQTVFAFEVFVVDNGSHDSSAEMVRTEFPEVELIANDGNLGFARANNQAFRRAAGEFIFLLNPDTFVFETTLDSLAHWLKYNRRAGLAGCRLLDEQGVSIKGQVRKFPNLFNQLAVVLKLPYLFPGILNGYLRANFDYNEAAPVDTVRGSALMIRRSSLENAFPDSRLEQGRLLDERFFIWFEDVDLCRTFKAAEEEVWYTPAARCYDQIGQSFSQLPRLTTQKYFRASMLAYFRKWKPAWQYAILWLAWPIGMTLTFIYTILGFERKK